MSTTKGVIFGDIYELCYLNTYNCVIIQVLIVYSSCIIVNTRMTKTWLYVLRSITHHPIFGQQAYYYVGMTYRLVRRMNEHFEGKGSNATLSFCYDEIVAVYQIDDEEQHDHRLENILTLQLMKLKGKLWWQVKGGKWCKERNVRPKDTDNLYVFDELGLVGFSTDGSSRLLTHVIFHPVQKSLNRLIQVDYTVRIQSLTGFNEG